MKIAKRIYCKNDCVERPKNTETTLIYDVLA